MSEPFAEQPLEFITNTNTMNASDDETALDERDVVLLENFVKKNGVFEVREGIYTPFDKLATTVYGLSSFIPLDSSTLYYVAVSNGSIYACSSPPTWGSVMSGLTTGSLMKLLPFQGKMLINDSAKGVAWYDGTLTGWTGIPSPKESKLIEDYETVTGWSVVSGTATIDDTLVIHGRHGVKFKATSGTTYSPRRTITSVNLNVFPSAPEGDAAVSTTKDYIRVQLSRSFRSDFTTLDLVLQSSTGNWSYARLSDFPEWQNNDGPGVVFDFFIRKGQFQTGAGTLDWTGVTSTGFDIVAPTGKTPFIVVDYLRLERAGPNASEIGKLIASFESDETWTVDSGTNGYEYKYKTNLSRAIKIGNAAVVHRDFSPVLDLTKFTNGADAATLDDIEVRIARDSDKLTGTLTISLRDTAGTPVTATYAINATSILTPRIGSTAASKLKNYSLVYQVLLIKKTDFTNYATLTWSSIDRVTLTASATAGYFYIDEIRLVKHKDNKILYRFEKDETVPTVSGSNKYGYSDQYADFNKFREDEGSSTSFYVHIRPSTECTIDVAFSPDIDLSQYAGATAPSQDSDLLGPWIWISESKNIAEISLLYDTNDGAFTSYYIKQLLRGSKQIPNLTNKWFSARFEKREHEQIPATGATGGWANICKARIKVTTNKHGGVHICLDQWLMIRGENLTGRFWYAITYKNSRGARSELSNFSQPVEVHGGNVMLSDLPVSTGQLREVWRIGGLTDVWKLAGVIGDDESTYYEDWITEDDLGEVLPELYQKPPKCKTFCVHDDLVIRGNLTVESGGYQYKTMVAVGPPGSIDEIDPLKTFDLGKDDGYEILTLIPFNDRIFVFKERGIVSFDPYNLDQAPIWHSHEIGIIGPMAYAIDPAGMIYFISENKHIYAFNGSTFDDTFSEKMSSYLMYITSTYKDNIVGAFYNNCLQFALPYIGSVNNYILNYDTKEKTWSLFTGLPTSVYHVASRYPTGTNYGDTLYAGYGGSTAGNQGKVYIYGGRDSDDGTVIVGVIKTAARAADPTITGQVATLYLTARVMPTLDPQ